MVRELQTGRSSYPDPFAGSEGTPTGLPTSHPKPCAYSHFFFFFFSLSAASGSYFSFQILCDRHMSALGLTASKHQERRQQ